MVHSPEKIGSFHPDTLRVMTYNVRSCLGLDFRRSEKRIAEVIAANNPDIVALQELDLCRRRSRGVDQADLIARQLGFHRYFHPAMRINDEHYGDAILSRWPITLRRADGLPSKNAFLFKENRGALWVEIATPQGAVQIITTHLGLGVQERKEQAESLLGAEWLGAAGNSYPVVLLGDFNSLPGSSVYRLLRNKLHDASGPRHPGTFPTPLPVLTLDYIFHNPLVQVRKVFVAKNAGTLVASDHFPLVAEISLRK